MVHRITRNYVLQLIAAILGIALSLYLLVQHTRLKSGIQDSASFCTVASFADCDVVTASKYSEIFGLPIASLGAIFFFIMLMGLLLSPPGHEENRRTQGALAWWSLMGLAVDLYLGVIQIFILKTICLLCFATYGLNLILLILILRGFEGPFLSRLVSSSAIPRFKPRELALFAVALAAFTATLLLAPSAIWLRSQYYAFVNNAVEHYYKNWKALPSKSIEVSANDGSLGNPNASVKIVEFSDYECPFCRKAAFTFHTLVKAMPNDVHFVFKNFPLDSSCNPMISEAMHPAACRLAQLGYCANKKGKFWEFHDLVFFSIGTDGMPAWNTIAEKLQPIFTQDEISNCLLSEESKNQVRADIEQGRKLGIRGTPAVYINGKMLDQIPMTIQTIRKLIELEKSN